MKYAFLIFQCFLFASSLNGQSIFDVFRDSSEIKEIESIPFEEIQVPIQEIQAPITIEEVQVPIQEIQAPITIEEVQVPIQEIQAPSGINEELANPFEVSHIPIRKNQKIKSVSNRDGGAFEISKEDASTISPLSIIFLSALILGLILFYYRGIVADIIQSLMNMNYMQSFMAKSVGQHLIRLLGLYLIFLLNAGLFIVLCYKLMAGGNPTLPIYYVILSILVIYVLRHLFLLIFGWIFELEGEAGTFSFLIALLNMSIGLMLIPINLFIAFAPTGLAKVLVFIGLFVILVMLVLRYSRGVLLSSKWMRSAPFQFFLYFCTFEIAPVLVILYWIGRYG